MGRIAINLSGQTFGKLTVLGRADNPGYWFCTCACGSGEQKVVRGNHLTGGTTKSCGCSKESHGHTSGGKRSPTYTSWSAMKNRCSNPNDQYFKRGVKYTASWEEYRNFLADMGERPPGKSLERKDVRSGYFPWNCEWADAKQQANNKTNSQLFVFEEGMGTLSEWARTLNSMIGKNKQTGRPWSSRDLRHLLKVLTFEEIICAVHPNRLKPVELRLAGLPEHVLAHERELDEMAAREMGLEEELEEEPRSALDRIFDSMKIE